MKAQVTVPVQGCERLLISAPQPSLQHMKSRSPALRVSGHSDWRAHQDLLMRIIKGPSKCYEQHPVSWPPCHTAVIYATLLLKRKPVRHKSLSHAM